MENVAEVGIGALIYGVIREIVGAIISIRNNKNELDSKQRAEHEARVKAYTDQVKADYDLAKKELKEMNAKIDRLIEEKNECEKNTVKLEGKIELLYRLYGHTDTDDSKEHHVKLDE